MSLQQVFDDLLAAYGPQHWWPGDTPFEVMVGAVLTQNTAWGNVEKAIANLKKNDALSAEAIVGCGHDRLAAWLKPSGYFNIKATRLQNFCRWYLAQGGFEALNQRPTDELRHGLLSVNGVGPETADDMLLYAFERPVFVIDAYTRRLFSRLGLVLRPGYIDGCRAPQTCPGKAPFAANGCSISKNGNAAWARLGSSLRASRKGVIHGVASLGNGTTITCEMRLVANPFPTRCIRQYNLGGVLVDEKLGYETLRSIFETALPADVALFNEYHALIVRHAKGACRKRPLCEACPLAADCLAAG